MNRFTQSLHGLVFFLTAITWLEARPPNVVLIMADDMGYECLGAYGSTSYRTPRLDELAAKGVRFNHCYSTPLCTPSRVQIMTGRYNCFNYEEFGYLNPEAKTFGHMMRDAGYATMIAGKWQLNGISHGPGKFPGWDDNTRPRKAGFDEYSLWQVTKGKREAERFWDPIVEQNGEVIDEPLDGKYGPDHFTDYICDFIGRKKDQPFFIYYPMVLVHDPFIHTPDSISTELSEQEAFADMVAYTDKLVGRIHDKLEEHGLLENTVLMFTGDNGTHVRLRSQLGNRTIQGGKGNTIDAGIHVPFIVYWKGRTPRGLVSEQLIDFTDFHATLADLIGLPERERAKLQLDGISFLPTLEGKRAKEREWVFCYYEPKWGRVREYRGKFALNGEFKVYHDGRIFDLTNDILERTPLAGEGIPADIHSQLKSALKRYPAFPREETPFQAPLVPRS